MKQYTLLYLTGENKVVHNAVFLSMKELKEFKYGLGQLKDLELKPVDKEGYVWFLEDTNEEVTD